MTGQGLRSEAALVFYAGAELGQEEECDIRNNYLMALTSIYC